MTMKHLPVLGFGVCLLAWTPSFVLAQDDAADLAASEDVEPEPIPEEPPPPDPVTEEPVLEPVTEEPIAEPEPAGSAGGAPVVVQVHTGAQGRDDDDDEEEEEEEPEQGPFDPHERQDDELFHFGVFARGIFVPQFLQNIFVAGGNDALRPGAGAFFNYRRNGFNLIVEVWGADFYNTAPYRGLNETNLETEWIESELRAFFVSVVGAWSITLTSFLALEIGIGLGMGGVLGNLWRTEAYPDATATAGWTPCRGEGDPPDAEGGQAFCDRSEANGGEGSYQRRENSPEPHNFTGGVPPLWFWLDIPRVSLRIKPIRQMQIRVSAGYALYGFHFGGSLAVGF